MAKKKYKYVAIKYDRDTVIRAFNLLRFAYKSEAFEIPIDKIKFIYKVHINGDLKKLTKRNLDELLCIVVPIKDSIDEYSLLLGWADYQHALKNNFSSVKALIVNRPMQRQEFLNNITYAANNNLPINSIILKNRNSSEIPFDKIKLETNYAISDSKLKKAKLFYERYGIFMSQIVLNNDYILVDGYSSYCLAKDLGLEKVDVIFSN